MPLTLLALTGWAPPSPASGRGNYINPPLRPIGGGEGRGEVGYAPENKRKINRKGRKGTPRCAKESYIISQLRPDIFFLCALCVKSLFNAKARY
jgi:hypothetical protein